MSEKLILAKVLTAEWVVHVLSDGDFQSLRTWGRMERPETQVCLQALFGPAPRSLPASPGGLCGQQWAAPDTGLRLWSLTGAVSWIDKIPTICQMTSPGVAASGLPSKSWGAGGLCTLLLLLGPGAPPLGVSHPRTLDRDEAITATTTCSFGGKQAVSRAAHPRPLTPSSHLKPRLRDPLDARSAPRGSHWLKSVQG